MFVTRSETFKFVAGETIHLPCDVSNAGKLRRPYRKTKYIYCSSAINAFMVGCHYMTATNLDIKALDARRTIWFGMHMGLGHFECGIIMQKIAQMFMVLFN